MNYLHSPSRYHNTSTTSKSPLSLFDSPTFSGNRFSDQYQALSCESPPPNFDDLQTPLQAQHRRTLDWGLEANDRPSPSVPMTTTTTATATATYKGPALTDVYKKTPERSSAKVQSPLVTPERPTKAAAERMNAALYRSPLNEAPLVKYELSPLAKKTTTPTQLENTSPLGEQDSSLKKSPLAELPSRVRRPLKYISSPIRNTVAPSNTTTSPLHKSPHYFTPTAPPPPNDQSPIDRSSYQQQRRRPSLPSASPSSLNNSPAQQSSVVYRSPVYSNSSYKPIAKQAKSPVDLHSPSASTQQQQEQRHHSASLPQPTQKSSLTHIKRRSEQTVTMDTSQPPLTNKRTTKPPQSVSNVTPRSPVARYHDELPHYMRSTESYQSRIPITTSTAPSSSSYPHQLHRKPSTSSVSSHRGELPHYMRATESYQSRLQAQVDQAHHAQLHRTKSRGVVKRARTPQQFQSSTKINAIDEIKSEMAPEDVYIPLAARVKLFEKGLGNSASSSQNEPTGLRTQRVTKAKSPYLLTRERSATSSHHCHELDDPPRSLNDRLAQTVDPPPPKGTKRSHHEAETMDRTIPDSKRAKHVKPFHFATDDRAARYQRNFKEKLNLWKQKDLRETN
ncbi:hypothetical protein [Absidia glauca]|uniref:Uncharacterized protein n=1 Tax=Absidia glauca TaxID=4829 RepID=A0A168NWM2_ABSGL|nr:hypothetical protein [Absidia glauca]